MVIVGKFVLLALLSAQLLNFRYVGDFNNVPDRKYFSMGAYVVRSLLGHANARVLTDVAHRPIPLRGVAYTFDRPTLSLTLILDLAILRQKMILPS